MVIPKVFISYSHDTLGHKKWVLELATRLMNNGVESIIDQWDLGPGDDLPTFMEKYVTSADRVLMICTDKYVDKANSGKGGVGYEKMIITSELMVKIDSNKIIPIIRQKGTRRLPVFLQSKLYIDFSKDDEFEISYDELVRSIHGSPLFQKPKIGNNPFASPIDRMPQKTVDSLLEVMKIVVDCFESGSDLIIPYPVLIRNNMSMSRTLFDLQLELAQEKELIKMDSNKRVTLLPAGKMYAIENKLV
ncbi:MAG: toll/interleukin-1 receptor domain-containing protein [Candidatus Marinimicrobia bacterium]|nr:toll/interleukin-1 receptor domain-containing protein [Candidatus Neomarinimicrobiota bacterium]